MIDHIKQMIAEKVSYVKVRNWVFDKLENSDMDVDQLRDGAKKKFGSDVGAHVEKAMSEMMD